MNARQIANALIQGRPKYKKFASNLFLYKWESDLLEISQDGEVIEYEIKTTKADFKADFQKEEKHNMFAKLYNSVDIPNYFYFLCEEGVILEKEVPEYAGLIYIISSGMKKRAKTIKKAPVIGNHRLETNYWQSLAWKLL